MLEAEELPLLESRVNTIIGPQRSCCLEQPKFGICEILSESERSPIGGV